MYKNEDISVFLHRCELEDFTFLYKTMKNRKTFDIEPWTL